MTEADARISYEFHGFRLDPQQRILMGADGQPIPLPPKVFETLLYFVERRGELLEKATLLKAIWPNVVVEENSLNQNISALRRVLGESPGQHRFIATDPGRGYRFVAPVKTVATSAVGSASRNSESRVSEAAAPKGAATVRSSIAVLPFVNLTGDPSKEYFSDGMAEELIHTLARLPGLRVPSRTSSFAYKGRQVDLRQIARDLQVGKILEGSVRSAGERVRVTAQLIDAESDQHLWSENYDRKFEDLFELQEELAKAIVRTLKPELEVRGPHTPVTFRDLLARRPLLKPPTDDLEAYTAYMQALSMPAVSPEGMAKAARLLQDAIARDPRFARAYNALAGLRAVALVVDVPTPPGTLAEAEHDAAQALTLDPDLAGAHGALGTLRALRGSWVEAEQSFRTALAQDDSDPAILMTYGTHLLGSVGHEQRYWEMTQQVHRLSPAWFAGMINLAVAGLLVEREAEAQKYLDLALAMGLPRMAPVPDVASQMHVRAGEFEDACKAIIESWSPPLRQANAERVTEQVFAAMASPGKRGEALGALDRLRAELGPAKVPQPIRRRFMLWYTELGALPQAFEIANESLDQYAPSGTLGAAWGFLWMKEMLPFRQDPKFQQLAARMKLFDYWNEYGPPDNCELRDGKLICR
jgi:TolB-like protein/Tfp pilus assembly protein PilF